MTTVKSNTPSPVYLDRVQISGGFWGDRQTINRNRTIPAIHDQLERTGRLAAWGLNYDKEKDPRKERHVIYMFWDSDTGKYIEAVGYSLHTHPDPALQQQTDALIEQISRAQQPDGYLNTYFTSIEPEMRWRNLRDWHEMYNAGHLIEGAVAYYRGTGKRELLDTLSRYADHIDSKFGPEDGKKRGYPGHPELEMALVKLYNATGEQRYLDLTKYFIDERGHEPHYFDQEALERGDDPAKFWATSYHYCQAHQPLREQETATGHAVRACYLYAGVADIARETDDQELVEVSRRLWDDLTQHQMYITGGLGPARTNEGFTFAYDMPNETAYAETCAGIALAFWAHRMFHIDPDGRYIDVMERALYNNVLSGVSIEGDHFFYANPLAAYPNVDPTKPLTAGVKNQHYRREPWFFCPCCPPNLARIVASLGGYIYSTTADRLYVHLYNNNTGHFEFGGRPVEVQQQTDYPWDGRVQLTVKAAQPTAFEIALRVPGWCRAYTVEVNGQRQQVSAENGYIVLSREWADGDTVVLNLEMPVERMLPHPLIREDAGQIALQRGPIVYCLEQADNGPQLANVIIPGESGLTAEKRADLLGGIVAITGSAIRVEPTEWGDQLYKPQNEAHLKETPFVFTAIPYFLWANREPGEMRVWMRAQ
jgi:DUF1680 family protein